MTIKNTSNRFLGFLLSLTSGLMTSIICFDLIPEALETGKLSISMIGIVLGIIMMIICDIYVDNLTKKQKKTVDNFKESLLKSGIVIGIGLAIHNFPEGLAIGSGFESSLKLGFSLALIICLHDIPEGIAMSVPMKNGGIKPLKVLYYVVLSGVTTGIGAFFGAVVGGISEKVISICLSFAAGAMLYIISAELIPESNKLYHGKLSAVGNIVGFLIGILAMNI